MYRYNALEDEFLTIKLTSGTSRSFSLPDVFELAFADQIASFPRMRPHQRPALHAFLVQLGGMACESAGLDAPPAKADEWQDLLAGLTPDWPGHEPWHLVVGDISRPAFLQPPQPEGAPPLKNVVGQPDKLDLLVTSKNHDLKQRRMADATPEDWFFALLSLQTQEGFLGAGNYGIARMNGGFANRSLLSLAPEAARFGGRVARDIRVILSDLDRLYEDASGVPNGHALLWLEPWDGSQSLALNRCHPLFIEICRRVRLVEQAGRIQAHIGNSKVARVDAKQMHGAVGDPWLPLNIEKEIKAMTLAADGFSYRRMAQLLAGVERKYQLPYLARPAPEERGQVLAYEAYGLVRGQGKTEGFHQRRVVVPPKVVGWMAEPDKREHLAERCKGFLDLAAAASGKALRPALIQLFQGRKEVEWTKPSNDGLCRPWLDRMDQQIDHGFFPLLFETLDAPDDQAHRTFSEFLVTLARQIFEQAVEARPLHPERREFAHARASVLLSRALHKQLPALRQALDTQAVIAS